MAAALLAAGAAAGGGAKTTPLTGSVRISFAGEGRQVLSDYKQWIFQSDQECYYDREVHQTATFQWSTSFGTIGVARLARPSSRSLSGVQTAASGAITGPELRGDCGSDDVPPGWVADLNCQQNLQFSGAGSLRILRARRGTAVLVLSTPDATLQSLPPDSPSLCSLIPRADGASATVSLSRLSKLQRGKSMAVPIGATNEVDCSFHPAPYEGTQVTDECHDTLTWHGTLTISKS